MELHELHRRRLEATLPLVENGLDRMERLLEGSGEKGIAHAVESTLPEEERTILLEKIRRLRNALRTFAERFALREHQLDLRQVLNAELSSAWVMLENCRPKRMKGYGVEWEESVRAELDEHVNSLLAQVIALRGALR